MPSALIVDDSRSSRHFWKYILSQEDFTIIEAENGLDALEKLEIHHVDLMIVDIFMPKMDGPTFVKTVRLKNEYISTPIVISASDSQCEVKMKEIGATIVLAKPFNYEKIISIVYELLSAQKTGRG